VKRVLGDAVAGHREYQSAAERGCRIAVAETGKALWWGVLLSLSFGISFPLFQCLMILLRLATAGLLLASLLSRPATAQVLDATFTSPTNLYAPARVAALGQQQADGKVLVAGTFSRVNGTAVSHLVRLDATGALDQSFSQNVGVVDEVSRIRNLPNGQYLLGNFGSNVTAGGISRASLLRLNANGTADASFNPGTGAGSTQRLGVVGDYVVQPDSKTIAVGDFDSFNGVPVGSLVRLNPDGSVDTGFSVGQGSGAGSPNGYSAASAVALQPDGKVLVCGLFTTFNGQPASRLVRLNANGSPDPNFTSPLQQDSNPQGLVVQPDGKIIISGDLVLNGIHRNVLRLLPSGSPDAGFAPSAAITSGEVNNLQLQSDGKMLLAGFFPAAGSRYLVRLNADGTQDQGFSPTNGPDSTPVAVSLQANGSILLGGDFPTFNGKETPLGRLNSVGSPDPAFAPTLQIAGYIAAVVQQADGKLVIGGSFTELNGQPMHRLARLTPGGSLDAGFAANTPVLSGPVNALVQQADGKLLAGTQTGVVRVAANGIPDPTFNSPSLYVSALAIQADGRVLAGGIYTGSGGSSNSGLVRLASTGALDATFNISGTAALGTPIQTNTVLVQPDGRVVAGSLFFSTSQQLVAHVVRYDATGALDPTFNNTAVFSDANGTTSFANRIFALALQPDGKLLVGGHFGAIDGSLFSGVARLTPAGTPDTGFAPNASLTGEVNALALQPNGRVLVGGSFSSVSATSALTNLGRSLSNGQPDASFGSTANPNGPVYSLLVQPNGAVVLAGSFTTVGGQPAVGLARIVAANVLAVAAPAAVAARTSAWPVPAHGLLHVAPDASARPLRLEICDALGRLQRQRPATSTAEQTLDLTGLPAGLYLLRVHYAAGDVTRRIVVE
jgi:uncharacterized delta-60 repeat protein